MIAGTSHALWLEAIPSGNDTLLFAGTQDLFRCSLAAGCVWRNATNVNTLPGVAQVGAEPAWRRVGGQYDDALFCKRSRAVAHQAMR